MTSWWSNRPVPGPGVTAVPPLTSPPLDRPCRPLPPPRRHQIHGDAALSAQGVIQESLAISNLPHTRVGGSIHLAINNQVGYTTPESRARSSSYCTDVAKLVDAPVIRANGDFPEVKIGGRGGGQLGVW